MFGIASPYIDAQLIQILNELFQRLGLSGLKAHINSLGCPECRPNFQKALLAFLTARKETLCDNCLRRMEKNPLRTLDCKVPACRKALEGAPTTLDYLCPGCSTHFDTVQSTLKAQNVDFIVDNTLVRGLDYYSRTAFEILTTALGAQSAVAGGGRYDALVQELGGPKIPAIGFAIGFDRLVHIVEQLDQQKPDDGPDLFLVALGDKAMENCHLWLSQLNLSGFKTEMDYSGKSLKSLMKRADKRNAKNVLIVGESEMEANALVLRNMETRTQSIISMDDPVTDIAAMLGNSKRT